MISTARCGVVLVLLLSSLSMLAADPAAARWVPAGPDGGTVSALAVAPSARRTVYAATSSGLIFRSTDAGASWSLAGPGLPYGSVSSLLVDRRDASTLYAGLNGSEGKGVFRSVDGGATWRSGGLPFINVWSLAMDPHDPDVLLAATGTGIFRSADGAASWSLIELVPGQRRDVLAVIFDPATPGRAWAAQAVHGVFMSSDGGATWVARGGLPDSASPIALAVDPSSGALFAGASLPFRGQPLYRSTDDGASWAPVSVEETTVFDLAVSPGPAPTIYAATNSGVFHSTDGGVTWIAPEGRLGNGTTRLAVPPFPASAVYAGTFGSGVFKSTDRGASWHRAGRGFNAAEIQAFAVAPSDSSILYAHVRDLGVFRSTDGGRTWEEAGRGIRRGLVRALLRVHPRDPRTAYLAADHGQVWKTTNGGASWRFLSDGEETGCMGTLDLEIDPVDPDNLYAAGFNEGSCASNHEEGCLGFRSIDGGESWTCMEGGNRILAIDPARPSTLFSGADRQIFRSTDAGRTWRDLAAAFLQEPGRFVQDLAVVGSSPETVHAATSRGIFQSVDGGITWRSRGTGLPPRPNVYELAGAPSAPLVLYAAVAKFQAPLHRYIGSLYRTKNGAASWTAVALDGLPRGLLVQMQIHPAKPGILFVAPDRGGLYRLTS